MSSIKLGTGIDDIKFGIKPVDLEKLLGVPSDYEIANEEEELTIIHYDNLNLSFGFSKDYDNKLLSMTTSHEDAKIEDISMIGATLQEVFDKLEVLGIDNLDIEDISTDDLPGQQLLTVFEYSLNLWFDNHELAEIQWGPFWDNEKDEPVWPE